MGEIKVSGRMKVKSFYNAFNKEFPYLIRRLYLLHSDDYELTRELIYDYTFSV